MYFNGEVAIVTGGGNGIGEAAALLFAEEGAVVVVADRDAEAAENVAGKIQEAGGKAVAFQGDLTKPESAEEMVALTLKTFGRLDCAFNNVGGALPGAEAPMHEIDLDLFEADLRLNFHASFYCMRAEIRHMLPMKKGRYRQHVVAGRHGRLHVQHILSCGQARRYRYDQECGHRLWSVRPSRECGVSGRD